MDKSFAGVAMKTDSALPLVITAFFGLGMVLMSFIQKQPNANQVGLESFIYGLMVGPFVTVYLLTH